MTETVIIAIIGGVVSIVSLLLNLLIKQKVNTTHTLINSRMDEMLLLTKEKGEAEGNLKGREEMKTETAAVTAHPIELKIPQLTVEIKPPPTDTKI